jgi:NADH-quinone oxidoreductase subunit G
VSKETLLAAVGGRLDSSDLTIGIGSARASLESNYALRRLVGTENFYMGVCDAEVQLFSFVIDLLRQGPVPAASMNDVGLADAVLILGEDVSNVAPMLELALRRSILRKPSALARQLHIEPWNDAAVREALQTEKGPLFIATTHGTDLDAVATDAYHAAPQDIARLGFATANKLDGNAPGVPDLAEDIEALAGRIAQQLADSERPLILTGVHCGSRPIIEAVVNVACALYHKNRNTRLCVAAPACNSIGLGLIGGKRIESVIEAVRSRVSAVVIILENDIYRHLDVAEADGLLYAANHVIAIDHIDNRTTAQADFVLPAATFAESTGTLVNNEGRAQRFFKVLDPAGDLQDSWRWIADIMAASGQGQSLPWRTFDEVLRDMVEEMPVFGPLIQAAPAADFRMVGEQIPRQPHRHSGRTAISSAISVHEPKPPADPDSCLAFSMEGYPNQPPPSLITRFWAPNWNSVQAVQAYQEQVGGPLRGGNPGERLLEPPANARCIYFTDVPDAFESLDGCLLVVPGYHIFGSDELSMLSPAVAELAAKPYIAVNPQDAGRLAVDENGLVEVPLSSISHYLPVRLEPKVPPGLAVVPMGLPGIRWNGVPVWRRIGSTEVQPGATESESSAAPPRGQE